MYHLANSLSSLIQVHTEREEAYSQLQKQREQLRQDRYLLEQHQKEHERLMRIGQRMETQSA